MQTAATNGREQRSEEVGVELPLIIMRTKFERCGLNKYIKPLTSESVINGIDRYCL
jgi:hypothetical protein